MTGSAAKVQETTFGEDENAVAIRKYPLVVLRLDIDLSDSSDFLETGHIDFIIEVPDITHNGLILHSRHVLGSNNVAIAGRRNEDVSLGEHALQSLDLVTLHRCLQGTNRIDLCDHNARALTSQRLRATLAHFPIAADDSELAGDHHVRCAIEAVDD